MPERRLVQLKYDNTAVLDEGGGSQ
jgi:hypothetical protein